MPSESVMTSIVMPQMGESLSEGTIVRWLKAPGQTVRRDEPLFEISTDKVDTEVPSPASGTLGEILVHEGETVAVGTPVALLAAAAAPAADAAAGGDVRAAAEAQGSAAGSAGGHFRASDPAQVVSRRRRPAEDVGTPRPERSYSPAVVSRASAAGLSLTELTGMRGSGRGGRVTKRDIEDFLRLGGQPGTIASPTDRANVPAEYLYRPAPGDRRVPMTAVRRQVADHMRWSSRISPQSTTFAECDVSRAAGLLQRERDTFTPRVGAPLTYTVLLAEAVVRALARVPELNASVVGDDLVLRRHVHLGVAVAQPDTSELVVPVIRAADDLSREGLAVAIRDLTARAREGGLTADDVQGGSFTLTDPGVFGSLTGTPLLHQPQVGILGLGAITKRPVVVDDAIAIRPIMMLALTFDHRAVDGMVACRFLEDVRSHIEQLQDPPPDQA